MSVDLHALLKLVHRVSGFLGTLTPEQLAGVADGRVSLMVETVTDAPSKTTAATVRETRQPATPRRSRTQVGQAPPDVDYAEIAAELRSLPTSTLGHRFLADLRIGGRKCQKADLLAIAAALDIRELPKPATNARLVDCLVDTAIGAQKRYEGLRP